MTGKIYLVPPNDELQPMNEQPYASEDLLQSLLERYPDLLAGDQIRPGDPRRWMLVSREFGVPDQENGSGRWALDHLFLDQDAIPTLVEVKRSADTRIRREVVGQMLDYAANAVVHWPAESIRMEFESNCKEAGRDPDQQVAELLQANPEESELVERFWGQTKTNLQAGKIRMVFVADEIPPELQRIVEFLNEQMDPAEVLAVEIRQYLGGEVRTLVPRVIGQTAEAQQKSSAAPQRRRWDESTFFEHAREKLSSEVMQIIEDLYAWTQTHADQCRFGSGANDGSFTFYYTRGGQHGSVFSVYTSGTLAVNYGYMRKIFTEEMIEGFKSKLTAIPTLNDAHSQDFYYNVQIERVFAVAKHLEQFKEVVVGLRELVSMS